MVQNKIKGTDLAPICLERWLFFFSKEALSCIIFQSMNIHPLLGKKRPFTFSIRKLSKPLWWLPIACGNRSQLLNRTWEALYDPSLSHPLWLSPGHIPPHTPTRPTALGYLPFITEGSSLHLQSSVPSGHATSSLEFLSHQAHRTDPKINTTSVMPSWLFQSELALPRAFLVALVYNQPCGWAFHFAWETVWEGLDSVEERAWS